MNLNITCLNQELDIEKNVLKLVIYVTDNKTSSRMLIFFRKGYISPCTIFYQYDVHIMVLKCVDLGLPV